jgi:hypothetical protein
MNRKTEILAEMATLRAELVALRGQVPTDYTQYNDYRLRHDVIMAQIQSYQTEVNMLQFEEQLQEQLTGG